MIFSLLPDSTEFPDPRLADEDGLLAIGGDLSVARLSRAYQLGIFPWYSEGDPILWYSPHERCVIFPERIRISTSMRKVMRQQRFHISENQVFDAVIRYCAAVPRAGQDGTWINAQMQAAYQELHQQGLAHSIEVWEDQELVGGLYGVQVGHVFCGESMFSRAANASKLALICLAQKRGLKLIDCQLPNPHLASMGAEMISREVYMHILNAGIQSSALV